MMLTNHANEKLAVTRMNKAFAGLSYKFLAVANKQHT
jgi:hypothetical protein